MEVPCFVFHYQKDRALSFLATIPQPRDREWSTTDQQTKIQKPTKQEKTQDSSLCRLFDGHFILPSRVTPKCTKSSQFALKLPNIIKVWMRISVYSFEC